MHTPSVEPRPSLYYEHRVYPYARAVELDGSGRRRPVVVVGAGPIGLVVALELARHGVGCVLLEAERQVCQGSRAVVFTRRSMEILQQAGVAARMTGIGLPWRFGSSFYRGELVFRLQAPHDDDDRFGPLLNVQQQFVEEFLIDEAARQPLIELRFGHAVREVVRNDKGDHGGAALRVDTEDGEYEIASDWVVAADGARSALRSLLGLKMQGDAYEGRFVIADIRIDLDYPTERRAYFDPPWNPGNTVLMHREPHGIWRIDYQLPAGESAEEALRPESLAARIDAQLAMIGKAGTPWQLDWSSVYSARAMTLPDYVAGRVVFCGDAAHLLPIFGVRGANTGLQDSQNLGWKLALVCKGVAPASLLDTYSEERVGAAREVIGEASKSTRFMTPPSRGFRLLRDAVLSLSLKHDFVRPLYHWRTSRAHAYPGSRLNCADDDDASFDGGGVADGSPLRDVRLGDDDHLLDHLGAAFHLLVFGSVSADIAAAAQGLVQRGIALRVIAIGRAGPGSDTPAAGVDAALVDASGALHRKYAAVDGTIYLVRPDQHVCARWRRGASAARIRHAVLAAIGVAEGESS